MPAGTAAEYERCASRRERRKRNGQSRKAAEAEVAKVRGAFRKHIAADRDDESGILTEAPQCTQYTIPPYETIRCRHNRGTPSPAARFRTISRSPPCRAAVGFPNRRRRCGVTPRSPSRPIASSARG